jgi:hypothetical protein
MIARVAAMCREDTVAERKLQRALEIVPAPRKLGLKGMVSKRKDTPYRSGRSGHWLKMKNRARESGEAGGGRRKAEGGRRKGIGDDDQAACALFLLAILLTLGNCRNPGRFHAPPSDVFAKN